MSVIEEELGFELRPTPKWVKWTLYVVAMAWLFQVPGFLLGLVL
jgi:hypothetical protein